MIVTMIPIVSIVGKSNSGKTTPIEKLVADLVEISDLYISDLIAEKFLSKKG